MVWPTPAPNRRTLAVAAGDLLVIAGVLTVGELRHGINPVSRPLRVLDTIVPFALAWVLVGSLVGAFVDRDRAGTVRVVVVGWLGAAHVALLLRGSPLFHGATPWAFSMVVTALPMAALLAWRLLAARY